MDLKSMANESKIFVNNIISDSGSKEYGQRLQNFLKSVYVLYIYIYICKSRAH